MISLPCEWAWTLILDERFRVAVARLYGRD